MKLLKIHVGKLYQTAHRLDCTNIEYINDYSLKTILGKNSNKMSVLSQSFEVKSNGI